MALSRPRQTVGTVALVSDHACPLAPPGGADAGGQNVYVASLAAELARRGMRVTVYTRRNAPNRPRRLEVAARAVVEYVDVGPPCPLPKDEFLPHLPALATALRNAWTAERPDVVHAHYWMSGVASIDAAAALRIPLVQTFHALGSVKRRHQREKDTSPPQRIKLEAQLARTADAVVATSDDELRELALLGVRPRRSETIPCGVDTTLFHPVGPSERRGAAFRIVVVGRLVERKGVDDVIRAVGLLPDVELVVAGGSGGGADADFERLSALAVTERIAHRVDLRGPLPHHQIPALLRSADLVVCFPWYEPFGLVAVEGMACGRPVVAAAVGGLQETVVHGETGLLVPPREPESLARALREILFDQARRSAMGHAARARATALYDWRLIGERMLALYGSLLAETTRYANAIACDEASGA